MNDIFDDEEQRLQANALSSTQLASSRAERELREATRKLEQKNEELRQQREWFEVTLSSIGDGVISTDTEGLVTFMNPAAESMTGWSREQALGHDLAAVFSIIDEACRLPAAPPVNDVLRENRAVAFSNHTVLLSRNGHETPVEHSAAPIRDSSGGMLGAVMVFRDVSGNRRAAQELEEETRALEILNRTGSTIAAQLDLEAAVQTVTDAATQLSGAKFGAFFYNETDEENEQTLRLFTLSGAKPEQFKGLGHPRLTPLLKATFEGKPVVRIQDLAADPRHGRSAAHQGLPEGHLPVRSYLAVPVVSRSGEVFGALVFGHPEADVFTPRSEHMVRSIAAQASIAIDNARLYEAAQREIASRLEAEEALLKADRMKDEFLATLAHELRNPLAPIRQAAELWTMPDVSPEQLAWSHQVVDRQSLHMSLLLNDLLDISRITRAQLPLRKEWISLATVVNAARETAAPLIQARQHELELDLQEGLALHVDPVRLSQVLANLLTNAAKYTPPHGTIRLSARSEAEHIVITVEDNGLGIDEAVLPQIFDMFSHESCSIDRAEDGLGIGLALVRGLVTLHGGNVQAKSDGLGKGSTFTVQLPIGHASGDSIAQPLPQASGDAPHDSGSTPVSPEPRTASRVLVADDNRDAADSLAMLLRLDGYEVCIVYDGLEALKAGERFRPDIVLLDIGMPVMDGLSAARRIREQQWGKRALLLALTGWGQASDREKSASAGFDGHLVKPLNYEELSGLIKEHRAARFATGR